MAWWCRKCLERHEQPTPTLRWLVLIHQTVTSFEALVQRTSISSWISHFRRSASSRGVWVSSFQDLSCQPLHQPFHQSSFFHSFHSFQSFCLQSDSSWQIRFQAHLTKSGVMSWVMWAFPEIVVAHNHGFPMVKWTVLVNSHLKKKKTHISNQALVNQAPWHSVHVSYNTSFTYCV